MLDSPLNRLIAAAYDPVTWYFERTTFAPHRAYLADGLHGRVLDVGAGTGAMFPHVAEAVGGSGSGGELELHALEPDPHMRSRGEARAESLGLPVAFHEGVAEDLPYADDSFDVAIASLVFCTIPDVEGAIDELARVLRPGGELRFFEHVEADGWRARLQHLVEPVWRRAAGGCHPTRRTVESLVGHGAFDAVEIERLSIGVTPIRPFVRGRLRRRDVAN